MIAENVLTIKSDILIIQGFIFTLVKLSKKFKRFNIPISFYSNL